MPWYLHWRMITAPAVLLLTFASHAQSNGTTDLPAAQPQATPSAAPSSSVLRATTRLVVVDVVAIDNKGNPVLDLKAEDFTLLEDGKPQKVSGFNFQRGNAATAVASATGSGGFSNAPQYKNVSSLNVILLDALNGNFSGHAYGRDELIKFLDKGTLNQPTALFALEEKLTLLHDFTTDIASLKAFVQDFKPQGPVHVDNVYAAASPFAARAPNTQTSVRSMDITIAALNSLARALAGYPGRKNLIWVSEGFPITLFPEIIYDDPMPFNGKAPPSLSPATMAMSSSFKSGVGKDFDAEVQKVANALMNAQVAVYPVDASGLQKDNHLNAINTMRSLADRTGGKAFYNRNDLEVGIRTSIDDGSTYYTLEYYPENKTWDGKFRVIQIKGRSGVSLHYRQGYYALDPGVVNKDAEKAMAKTFSDSLSLDAPSATAVVFRAGITPPSDKAQQVTVNFAIDPHTLAFQHKEGGLESATISCAVAAFSEKGLLVKEEITNMTATIKADDFETMMKGQQFPCKRTIDLKPGSYNLTLGVVDRNSRLIGTTTAWVKVP
ncbi:MAG TPA: VWA domain-containing protein [Verrucomicrobiae bacterium]|jgi:VWFA-related protein|nr:VWA domain-containing protein [Verrucomicrobiae bacterium]